MTADRQRRIPAFQKLAYAAPAFALAVVGIPVYIYLPKFYADTIGIDITLLGYILLGARIFDAATDPVIGLISDRTDTRFGRRRPYILLGSFFVVASLIFLFNPPILSPILETLWFAVSIFSLFLFWTVVVVPYEALGPEITFDHHERTTLFGIRDGALIAGTLAAASAPALVEWLFSLPSTAQGERNKFFWISVIYGPMVIGACVWCVLSIQEIGHVNSAETIGTAAGLVQILKNRPFAILLAAYTVSALGNNLPATLILFYVEYVLGSNLADLFLILYFLTGILFMPGWIMLSKKVGKKTAWLSAIAINTGAFIGVFFLGPGDILVYGILVFFSGIGFGGALALPSSIQADVIDYDELRFGRRREGGYIGIWSIAKKFAAAIGVGVGLSVLGVSGYEPNIEQTEGVRLTLRVLYALVPSLCNLAAFGIALAYPIDQKMHEAILERIPKRHQGIPVNDPVSGKLLNHPSIQPAKEVFL